MSVPSAVAAAHQGSIRLSGPRHAAVQAQKGNDKARAAVKAVLDAVQKKLAPKGSSSNDGALRTAIEAVLGMDANTEVESNAHRLTFKVLQQFLARHKDDFFAHVTNPYDEECVKNALRHAGRSASAFLVQRVGRKGGARMTFDNAASAFSATRAVYGGFYREPKRLGQYCSRQDRARCDPNVATTSTRLVEPKIRQMTKPGGAHLRKVSFTQYH